MSWGKDLEEKIENRIANAPPQIQEHVNGILITKTLTLIESQFNLGDIYSKLDRRNHSV
jgi:hypothetical protein